MNPFAEKYKNEAWFDNAVDYLMARRAAIQGRFGSALRFVELDKENACGSNVGRLRPEHEGEAFRRFTFEILDFCVSPPVVLPSNRVDVSITEVIEAKVAEALECAVFNDLVEIQEYLCRDVHLRSVCSVRTGWRNCSHSPKAMLGGPADIIPMSLARPRQGDVAVCVPAVIVPWRWAAKLMPVAVPGGQPNA